MKCPWHRGLELQLRHQCLEVDWALAPEEMLFDFFPEPLQFTFASSA